MNRTLYVVLFGVLLISTCIQILAADSIDVPPDGGIDENGMIQVNGSPGVMVSVDNVSMGVIPGSGTLLISPVRAGFRHVTVFKDGFYPAMQGIPVYRNKTSSVQTNPFIAYGGLLITSNPVSAEAYLDGVRVGNTPVQATQISVSNHSISLRADGYYDWERNIIVTWNEETTVTADLIPITVPVKPTDTPKTPGFTYPSAWIALVITLVFITWRKK